MFQIRFAESFWHEQRDSECGIFQTSDESACAAKYGAGRLRIRGRCRALCTCVFVCVCVCVCCVCAINVDGLSEHSRKRLKIVVPFV
jgi:hypothetical protein